MSQDRTAYLVKMTLESREGRGASYLGKSCATVPKSRAMRFDSHKTARKYAEQCGIELDGVRHSVVNVYE